MEYIKAIFKKVCSCFIEDEEAPESAAVELIAHHIENQKTVLNEVRLLNETIPHFGDHLKPSNAIALSSYEIWSMPEHEINVTSENSFNTNYLNNCLPVKKQNKPTLVLDLDNTLIYSSSKEIRKYDHIISISHNSKNQNIWILERPYLQQFLDSMHEKYEIVLFTAGIRQYGIKVIKKIDCKSRIDYLLDRRFCTVIGRNVKNQELYVKNLKILGRDLSKVYMIDDRDYSFCLDPLNGQEIPSFDGDLNDDFLLKLEKYLLKFADSEDFRHIPKISKFS